MDLHDSIRNLDIGKKMRERGPALLNLSVRYRNEPGFREQLDQGNNAEALAGIGFSVPPGMQVRFSANTPDTFHVVMPMDPNTHLSDESLGAVAAGGKTAGSAGSVGTASTFACATLASSVATAGTAGTAGTGGG